MEKYISLTKEQQAQIAHQTGWSDNVISHIRSVEEAAIYMKAGLVERNIGGRVALIREDINWSDYSIRRNTWLKEYLADWDKWAEYNNADLIGEPMVTRMSCTISVRSKTRLLPNSHGMNTWAMGITPYCIRLVNLKFTEINSIKRNPFIGRHASRPLLKTNSIKSIRNNPKRRSLHQFDSNALQWFFFVILHTYTHGWTTACLFMAD